MKLAGISAGKLRLSFRVKYLKNLTKVCLLVVTFHNFSAAAADVQQLDIENAQQLVKQAEKLTHNGNLPEAEKILRRAVQLSPQDSRIKLNLARNLLKQRHLVEAYNISFDVAKSEQKNSRAFAILGVILLNAGRFDEANISFINALQINKREALAWAGLGTLDFYENRMQRGLSNLRSAVFLEPNEPDYLFSLAQIASRAENYKEAADAYEKFLQISPRNDTDRRDRIKGLINFLRFLGSKQDLYVSDGNDDAVVSFKLVNDRPIIQLKINKEEKPFNFVLDTGSGISVISNETARRLNIKPVARGGLARAIGGDGRFEIVYGFLHSVELGPVKIKNVPIYIREFQDKGEPIDGYIGLSLISKFLTTIDYGNKSFVLKKRDTFESPDNNGELLSLPLRITSSGFLSGEVQLEGVEAPLNFIVDTGASVSVISDALAGTKEISRFLKNEKLRVIGAAGVTENVPTFLLPRVSFGKHSRESIMAVALNLNVINEASGFEQAGILGGNFLKNYSLTFDFKNSKVIFTPNVK